MPCPNGVPCDPYVTDDALCCLDDDGSLTNPCIAGQPIDPTLLDNVLMAATEVAWGLTGRQYGTCDVVVRPCFQRVSEFDFSIFPPGFIAWPYMSDGSWFNFWPCADGCSCHSLCEVRLPSPICGILEVRVDGVVLPASAYTVKNNGSLIRTDGECWPRCNDLAKPNTAEGTWSVSLTYGRTVPEILKIGTADFACELLKSCLGMECGLSRKVSRLVRQGVSMDFGKAEDFLQKGLTGVDTLDFAISVLNPHRVTRKVAVYSPDVENWNTIG